MFSPPFSKYINLEKSCRYFSLSHSGRISSSRATMRFCSARGGRGMKRLQTSDTLICFAPIPFCFSVRLQMTVGAIRILCKNSENTPVAQRISITRCPMHIFLPSGRIAALQIDPYLVYIISSFCGARRAIRIEYVVASTYLHFIISPFSLIQFVSMVQYGVSRSM